MIESDNLIKSGDYIVIQRQSFTKLHKIKAHGTVSLGKDIVELENVIGKRFYSTFRMVKRPKNKRVYTLEETEFIRSIQNVNIDKSGVDNRDILDDGSSQQLSTEEISKFRDEALSSSDIVEKLITNSKTFSVKTEYSQEKYLKKKEKKYFEYIQIRQPTLRLIAEIYYRLDPSKIQGIRIDDLSQILTYANLQTDSNVLLYDSGTCGLLSAAITNALGKNTNGTLIHMHPGNVCQKEAFHALKFPLEQTERCINVCLYSVLRCFYQEYTTKDIKVENEMNLEIIESKNAELNMDGNSTSEKLNSEKNESILQSKQEKKEETIIDNKTKFNLTDEEKTIDDKTENNENVTNKRKLNEDSIENTKKAKRPCWQIDNEKACQILLNKVDSIVIVAKEHPLNIVNELLTFLNYGKPFVVFSLLREPLEDLYVELKNRSSYIALKLTNNLMRNYQVLENRTHPDVNMTCGGYILTGFKINIKESE